MLLRGALAATFTCRDSSGASDVDRGRVVLHAGARHRKTSTRSRRRVADRRRRREGQLGESAASLTAPTVREARSDADRSRVATAPACALDVAGTSSRPAKRKTYRCTAELTLLDLRPALLRSRSTLPLPLSRPLAHSFSHSRCRSRFLPQSASHAGESRSRGADPTAPGRTERLWAARAGIIPSISPVTARRKGTRSIASLRTSWIADAVVCRECRAPCRGVYTDDVAMSLPASRDRSTGDWPTAAGGNVPSAYAKFRLHD